MKLTTLLFMMLGALNLAAADYSKLPDWAQAALSGVDLNAPPKDADVWRLLDDTQITLLKNGKLEQRRRVVQYVVNESGAEDGSLFLLDGDERGVKIKRLKGWNLKSGGRLVKLDKANVVALGRSDSERLTTDTLTVAALESVTAGSIAVFETREIHETMFPVRTLQITASHPTRKRSYRLASENPGARIKIIPVHFDVWKIDHQITGDSIVINNIPGTEGEILQPDFWDPFPRVTVGFETGEDRLKSWDHLAKWYYGMFRTNAGLASGEGAPAENKDDLMGMYAYFNDKISYRQRYLSAARGWTPASGSDVERRAYGDCKDMVACLAWRSKDVGVYPVLANIGSGARTQASDPPTPTFNHLIGAVALKASMGLAAEVEVAGKRYLLFDPTAKYTRSGFLPGHYRGRSLMICTPDGAHWIEPPEAALEDEALDISILGRLDANYTLMGTITLTETGDAWFFRTLARSGNIRDLEWSFRRNFDLPGVVDLIPVGQPEIDDQQRLKLTYQIRWPSFLRRDSGGLRLPFGVVGYSKRRLVSPGKTRIQPIALNQQARTTWNIAVNSTTALSPGREQASWEDAYQSFQWEAIGGKNLKVTYVRERKNALFPKTDIQAGMDYWDTYRSKFNEFWIDGTIFMTQ